MTDVRRSDPAPAPTGSPSSTTEAPAAAVAVADPERDGLAAAARRCGQALIVVVTVAVVVAALTYLGVVVIPVLISLILVAALRPAVDALTGRMPRLLATWLVLLGSMGALVGLISLVVRAVRDEWPALLESAGDGLDEVQQWLADGPLEFGPAEIASARQSVSDAVVDNQSSLTTAGVSGATAAAEAIAGLFLALITVFFLLKDGPQISAWLLHFVPARNKSKARRAGDQAMNTLGGYARGTAVIALVDAVIIGIALLVLGVPLALPLAVVVFLGAFVPLLGATLAGVLCALVALVTNGPITALIVIGVVIVVNQVEGDVLAPIVFGRALSLHPLAILLALAAGTVLAGLVGAVLSVPVAAVTWTVIRTWWLGDTAGDPPSPAPPAPPAEAPAPA